MGVPALNDDVSWFAAAKREVARVAAAIGRRDLTDIGVCEIGNPHIVVTTDGATRDLMLQLGPALQKSDAWDGVNVHVARAQPIADRDRARAGAELGQELTELLQVFVWERGAGETMACGSGACAVAALALGSGLVDRDGVVGIDMPGGRLYVKHLSSDEPALLSGPATFVFAGKLTI
jgi:diaminopimelate epimerase